MAVRHVKLGGTKVSGNSTPDDWTLANCYGSINSVMGASGKAAGDEVVLEHLETFDLASQVSTAIGIDGAYTIRGRFARTNNLTEPPCTIRGTSGTGALLLFNDTVGRVNIEFRDIGFTKSVPHTDVNQPYGIRLAQKTGDVRMTRCWFRDIVLAFSGSQTFRMGAVRYDASPALPATVYWDGMRFARITANLTTSGLCSVFDDQNTTSAEFRYTDVSVRDFVGTSTGEVIFMVENSKLTLNGLDVEGLDFVSSFAGGHCAFIGKGEVGFFSARNCKFKDISVVTPVTRAMLDVSAEHDIDNVLGINVVLDSTNHDAVGGIGCLVAAFKSKRGRTRRVRAYRCQSKFGTAVYYSNGAYGVVDTVWAEECKTGSGIFYKGGNGDVAWANLVALNNERIDVVGTALPLVFYGHNGGSSGDTRDCVVGLRDSVFAGNTDPSGNPTVWFYYDPGLYRLTGVMRNVVCRDASAASGSILLGKGLVDLDIADCNLVGGIENLGTGLVTESGTTDSDVVIIGGLSMDTELDDRWPVAYRVPV